jgi:hypothetical protein
MNRTTAELRAELSRRHQLRQDRAYKTRHQPKPRYDEVYWQGVAWLDAIARGENNSKSGERE